MKVLFTEQTTMSSQLTGLVPILDGSNYPLWSKSMKAYLQSQGLWGYAHGAITRPNDPDPALPAAEIATAVAAQAAWDRANDMAAGNIVLRITPSINENLINLDTAEAVWDDLKD